MGSGARTVATTRRLCQRQPACDGCAPTLHPGPVMMLHITICGCRHSERGNHTVGRDQSGMEWRRSGALDSLVAASGLTPTATKAQRRCPRPAPCRGHAVARRTTPVWPLLAGTATPGVRIQISRDRTQRDGTGQASSFDPSADAEHPVGAFARRARCRHDRIRRLGGPDRRGGCGRRRLLGHLGEQSVHPRQQLPEHRPATPAPRAGPASSASPTRR